MVRKPTLASVFFAQAMLGFVAWELHCPEHSLYQSDAWFTVLWALPIVVAHLIRSTKLLFAIGCSLNVVLAIISTAILEFAEPDSELRFRAGQSRIAEALFNFPPLKCLWGQVLYAVLAAPLYALVGLAYAATCWAPSDSADAQFRDCVDLATAVDSKTDSPAPPPRERATDRPPRWALPAMLLYGGFLWALAAVLQRLI